MKTIRHEVHHRYFKIIIIKITIIFIIKQNYQHHQRIQETDQPLNYLFWYYNLLFTNHKLKRIIFSLESMKHLIHRPNSITFSVYCINRKITFFVLLFTPCMSNVCFPIRMIDNSRYRIKRFICWK